MSVVRPPIDRTHFCPFFPRTKVAFPFDRLLTGGYFPRLGNGGLTWRSATDLVLASAQNGSNVLSVIETDT